MEKGNLSNIQFGIIRHPEHWVLAKIAAIGPAISVRQRVNVASRLAENTIMISASIIRTM